MIDWETLLNGLLYTKIGTEDIGCLLSVVILGENTVGHIHCFDFQSDLINLTGVAADDDDATALNAAFVEIHAAASGSFEEVYLSIGRVEKFTPPITPQKEK